MQAFRATAVLRQGTASVASQRLSTTAAPRKPKMEAPSQSISAAQAPLVMQLIIDKTLLEQPGWSMGPMMAQSAHATSAILAQTYTQADTQAYLSKENLPQMRKVVLTTPAGTTLRDLSSQLQAAHSKAEGADSGDTFPSHHLWIEQPEDIPTVLAIAPNSRPSALKKVLNKCVLLRT